MLARSPTFRGMLKEAVQTWRGDMNAGTRITKKAEIVLEDAIPELDTIIHNRELPTLARIEAIKRLESLSGRNAKETSAGGSGFVLNINLGQGRQGVTIESSPQQVTDESGGS